MLQHGATSQTRIPKNECAYITPKPGYGQYIEDIHSKTYIEDVEDVLKKRHGVLEAGRPPNLG
jgi:hypothetical protein